MEITWAGLLFFPLTFFLLFPAFRLSKLLTVTIFILPFGAVAVANLADIPPGFGIGLDRYFSVILVAAVLFYPVVGKTKLERLPKKIKASFCLFFLTIAISLFVPFFSTSITIWHYDPEVSFSKAALAFSNRNITKTIEILFSALFFISIYKVMPFVSPKKITKILISSLFIMGASAFLDFLPGTTSAWQVIKNNISYPTVVGIVIGHFGEIRLSGLSLEPSHLIIYAACGLSIMCGFYKNRTALINRHIDFSLLIFFVILVILTFSSTMLVVFLLTSIYLMHDKKHFVNPKITLFILISFTLALTFNEMTGRPFDIVIGNAIGKMGISNKYGIYSEYRSFSFYAVADAFWQSPIIGVGWGGLIHQVGFPLLVLGSMGILGILACGYLIFSIFKLATYKLSKSNNLTEKALREGLILCFSIITVMCLYTKGWQYFLFLPLIFYGAGMCSNYGKCQPAVYSKTTNETK